MMQFSGRPPSGPSAPSSPYAMPSFPLSRGQGGAGTGGLKAKKIKMMQIGFAALLARKKAATLKYYYQRTGSTGFVFEPTLLNNEPELDDFEYMKKKFYSQLVYEGAMRGDLDTSIEERDKKRLATRRLWAGRKGTGWGGTGKGGYMDSLDPGIRKAGGEGTGYGTPQRESDLLLEMFMDYNKRYIGVLRQKSHEATYDLFNKVARANTGAGGIATQGGTLHYKPPTNWMNYLPPPKEMGIKNPNQMLWYLHQHLGDRSLFDTDEEWIDNVKKSFQRKFGDKGIKGATLKSEAVTAYGLIPQGDLADDIAGKFTEIDYTRLTQRAIDFENKETRSRRLGFSSLAGGRMEHEPDFLSDRLYGGEGGDYYDPDADLVDWKRTGGWSLADKGWIDWKRRLNFKGDAGSLDGTQDREDPLVEAKLLTTIFKEKSIDELFPKAWKAYLQDEDKQFNRMARWKGNFLEQRFVMTGEEAAEVAVKNDKQAKEFILWMQKELNEALAELNRIKITSLEQARDPTGLLAKHILAYPEMAGPNIRLPSRYPSGGKTIKAGRMGGASMAPLQAIMGSRGQTRITDQRIWGSLPKLLSDVAGVTRGPSTGLPSHMRGDVLQEILQGFLGDFEMFKSEGGYKMQNYWNFVKPRPGDNPGSDMWKLKNTKEVARGVDLWIPQGEGFLRIRVQAYIEEEETSRYNTNYHKKDQEDWNPIYQRPEKTTLHQPFVRLRIESSKYFTDLGVKLEEQKILSYKDEETLSSWEAVREELWREGAEAQYNGMLMKTHTQYGTQIFMGSPANPVNNVAFFTTTISEKDFAERLQFLVNGGASGWFEHPEGFAKYFDLSQLEGGAFKEWALEWSQQAQQLQKELNQKIEHQWSMWVNNYAGGGKTAPPPRIGSTWEGPLHLGPFVQSTEKTSGVQDKIRRATIAAQSVGMRPHGYYTVDRAYT